MPLYIYVLIWPLLYSFVEIDAFSIYLETNFMVFDFRLTFYVVFFLMTLNKIISGVTVKDVRALLFVFSLVGFFILSFIFNLNSNTLDFKSFFNGLLPLSIFFTYTWVYRHDINFETIAKLYSVSLIIISLFGFYSFSRFLADSSVIFLLRDGLSEQLWRLAGGKTQFIPAVFFLALLSVRLFKNKFQLIVFVALVTGLISILLSSQRTALIVTPFLLYSLTVMSPKNNAMKLLLLVLASFVVFYLFRYFDIVEFFNNTFLNKIQNINNNEQGRLSIWLATISILTSNVVSLIFGVGLGSLSVSNFNFWPIDISDPHNLILYFWSFGGFGAIFVLAIFILCLLLNAYKSGSKPILLFICTLLAYWVFAGFYLYVDSNRSDLNLLIVCLLFSFVSSMKERRYARHHHR